MLTKQPVFDSWLKQQLNTTQFVLQPIVGDASPRLYYRVTLQNKSLIFASSSPATENNDGFVAIAKWLWQQQLTVPQIIATDMQRGWMLLSDLGEILYLDKLCQQNADELYTSAMDSLIIMQQRLPGDYDLPLFDEAFIKKELNLFATWYLQDYLSINLDVAEQQQLNEVFEFLVNNSLEQPQTFVHRDYHSRNLLICDGKSPGIIDFQDAVLGPVTYDLVSLLKDCYIAWPDSKVLQWTKQFYDKLQQQTATVTYDFDKFWQWFELQGVQRHLKVLGIFARLYLRDNKPRYLHDMPRIVAYLAEVTAKYPQLEYLNTLLQKQILNVKMMAQKEKQ